jgi:putative ABC transport system permease protein
MSNFIRDASHAFRSMRRDPGFALATITSLAIGIAATTAVFSVASAVLLRSLPYRDPSRLAAISMGGAVTAPAFQAFQREAHSLEQAALFVNSSFNVTSDGGRPMRVEAARVSAGLFEMLGVNPRLGRAFSVEEDQPGSDNVALISDGLWRSEFGGDSRITGRSVILDGAPHTIIGVMPPGFQFPYGPELPAWAGSLPPAEMWRPMALAESERTCEGCYNFAMIARLRRGMTPAQARAELIGILDRRQPGRSRAARESLTVLTLRDALTRQSRAPIAILLGAVALALLIACVNVANLLLARGRRRQSEFALRLSLGATPWKIARQLLTEALTLATCAAALAIPLTWAAMRAILALAPAGIPRLNTIALDAPMLAFSLGVSLLSALLFGAAPALLSARQAPGEALKAGARTASAGPLSLRAVLVASELALSLVLLVGAGLLAKSFARVAGTPLGFHAENVLTMRMNFPSGVENDAGRARLIQQLAANCAALPGVTSAAAVSTLPLTGERSGWGIIAEDSPDPDRWIMVRGRSVTPTYFRTLGIRLLAGREFTNADRGDSRVVILSVTAARQLWPGVADPAGVVSRRLAGKPASMVVGIVEDTRASGLDAEIRPYLYQPISERSAPEEFALAIRAASDVPPTSLAAAVKQEVWRLDKGLPVTHVASMRQLVADSVAPRRFQAVLMTVFGVFSLLLAAVGVYGVLAYAVTQRTREFGIRMALGATGRDVGAAVFLQTGRLVSCGIVLGIGASLWLAPLLRGLLYGVAPWEFSVLGGCALLLAGVAAVAGAIPARRAAKLDPMICLRYE